jgi:hypothetical protein
MDQEEALVDQALGLGEDLVMEVSVMVVGLEVMF